MKNFDLKKKTTNLSGIILPSTRAKLHRMKYSIPNEAEFYNFQTEVIPLALQKHNFLGDYKVIVAFFLLLFFLFITVINIDKLWILIYVHVAYYSDEKQLAF